MPIAGVSVPMACSTRSASAPISSGDRSCVSNRRSAASSLASEAKAQGCKGFAVAAGGIGDRSGTQGR